MRREEAFLLVVGGVLVAGGAVVLARRRGGTVAAAVAVGVRVGAFVRQERHLSAAHPQIRAFFAEWKRSGPFDLFVPTTGGLRTDEAAQAALAAQGVSKAASLKDTAHGRGGAADAYPVLHGRIYGVAGEADWKQANALFDEYGSRAEAAGLVWGGRWLRAFPPSTQNPAGGDRPHVELADWRSLPMPSVGRVA